MVARADLSGPVNHRAARPRCWRSKRIFAHARRSQRGRQWLVEAQRRYRLSLKVSVSESRVPHAGDRPRNPETTSFASTSVVKALWRQSGAQIICRRFSSPAVCDDFKADRLSLVEGAQAGSFDRANMDKDIIPALCRLNEAKALLVVKPLHSSISHKMSFADDVHVVRRRETAPSSVYRFWRGF